VLDPTPAEPRLVFEGAQPLLRDHMARQLTDHQVYVHADDDLWFLVVPTGQEAATRATTFGSQLERLTPAR
jgi:hypothetical protein